MKLLSMYVCSVVCVTINLQQPVLSNHGLLTTVAYQLGPGKPATYALEVINCCMQAFNRIQLHLALVLQAQNHNSSLAPSE